MAPDRRRASRSRQALVDCGIVEVMPRRVLVWVAVVVAGLAVGACAVLLYRWSKSVKASSSAGHALSAAPLPQTIHDTLGRESEELRDLAAGKSKPAPQTRRIRATQHRMADLFPPAPPRALPTLRNTTLSNARDARVDDDIRALTSPPVAPRLSAAFVRSAKLHAPLQAICAAWKVPEALIAIVMLESGFDPFAEEGDRVGLWGFRAPEAFTYGLAMTEKYDERRSIALATEVAAHYLRDLNVRLGSWELAIGAFGTSYTHALEVVKSAGDNRYWVLASAGKIPDDIATYVARVLAIADVTANADAFHISIPPDAARSTSDLEVPSGTPFTVLAEATKIDVGTLHDLNPEFLTEVVPSAEFAMYVHVPSESLARARELLMPLLTASAGSGLTASSKWTHDASTVDHTLRSGEKTYYRVREGDTLESISKQFGVPADRIAADNAITKSTTLRPEMLLVLRNTSP
jgi:hypothetical protein